MAWGGGGFFGGGGGAGRGQWNMSAPGLPFAGVPPDMLEAVEKLTAQEPEFAVQDVPFTNQVDDSQPPFTLRRFLAPKRAAIAVVMVVLLMLAVAFYVRQMLRAVGP